MCRFIEPLLRELTIGMGVPHVNSNVLNNIPKGALTVRYNPLFIDGLTPEEIGQRIDKSEKSCCIYRQFVYEPAGSSDLLICSRNDRNI